MSRHYGRAGRFARLFPQSGADDAVRELGKLVGIS